VQISGLLFGICPSSGTLKNTTFPKLNLFPKYCVLLMFFIIQDDGQSPEKPSNLQM
jgi:hypothetical protein